MSYIDALYKKDEDKVYVVDVSFLPDEGSQTLEKVQIHRS